MENVKDETSLKLSILTMQKNEDLLLEPWIQYYSQFMPYENICVADNGSTDPIVINILKKYEEMGVCVIYTHNKPSDFEDKGTVLVNIAQEKYRDSDFVFFLDVDEFFCLKDYNCNKKDIFSHLKHLPRDKQYVYTNRRVTYNVCNNENYYYQEIGVLKKVFFQGGTMKELHMGFHFGKCINNSKETYETDIDIVHFHNKPHFKKQQAAREKMKLRIDDVNDIEQLRNYKGIKGKHNARILLETEEEFAKKMDMIKNDEKTEHDTNFREKLKEYGIVIPF